MLICSVSDQPSVFQVHVDDQPLEAGAAGAESSGQRPQQGAADPGLPGRRRARLRRALGPAGHGERPRGPPTLNMRF